jgi:hypothetical protein
MIAEARVFVQAGFETTAHSLAFSMGMTAERPDLAQEMAALGNDLLGDDCYNVQRCGRPLKKQRWLRTFSWSRSGPSLSTIPFLWCCLYRSPDYQKRKQITKRLQRLCPLFTFATIS